MEVNNKTISGNLVWRWLERCGAQGVTFIVSLVLARLLDPAHYGSIAIMLSVNAVLQVFVDSGLGNALIQKKNTDDLDFSTVFFFNLALCVVMYVLLFFLAPVISLIYKDPELTAPLRVMGIIVLVSGVKNVQQAYVSRNLMFRKFFFATLIGTLLAGGSGIWLAVQGFGIWALVAQYLVLAVISTICLWIIVPFRPKAMFSWERLKGLFSFGWKLLISSLIDTIYREIRTFLIGGFYTEADLGLYNKGEQFPKVIVTNINSSIDSVLLPALSKQQDNLPRMKAMTRRAIKTSSYIMIPFMVGLGVCAEPIVKLVIGNQWLECVPYLRIFCISFALHPIQTANLNAIKAIGRSDTYLVLEIIKKCIGCACLAVSLFLGVEAIAWGVVVAAVLDSIVNAFPNKKLLNYSLGEQLKDMLPHMALSLIMGAGVYAIGLLPMNYIIRLGLQVFAGVALYVGLSVLFKVDSFYYTLNMLKALLSKKKKAAPKTEPEKLEEQAVTEAAAETENALEVLADKADETAETLQTVAETETYLLNGEEEQL